MVMKAVYDLLSVTQYALSSSAISFSKNICTKAALQTFCFIPVL